MTKYIDQLTEDDPIPNQMWCCISFISPETLKNCNFRGIKIRGVFATKEEAVKRAEYLQKIDPDFNIFVGEVGKWLGWDPDPSTVEDQVYREKKLQDLMNNYKKNREKAKILEQERKREMLEESIRNEASKTSSSSTRDRLRRKLEKKRLDKKLEENKLKSDQKSIETKDKLITAEKQRISNNEQIIKQSTEDLSTVDEKLNELQAHYKSLLEKKKQKQKEKSN